ncbi:MAG: outer membrane beta-barrel protein [Bacteroidales bacterium]|nr:outer membrane beta-barrel protein [Bacteroidales bacterium]
MKKLFIILIATVVTGSVMAFDGTAPRMSARTLADTPPHTEFKAYGFYGIVDFTTFVNIGDNAKMSNLKTGDKYTLMGVTTVAGYQFNHHSAAGLGFSYLNDKNGAFSQVPVFVEYRSHFTRNRIAPYAAAQIGWSFPLGTATSGNDWVKIKTGGISMGLEAGARFAITRKIGLNLFVGYHLLAPRAVERSGANMSEVYYDPSEQAESTLGLTAQSLGEIYGNIKFGIGICF